MSYSDYVDIGRKFVLEGIIVVSIQYRLGVTGQEEIPRTKNNEKNSLDSPPRVIGFDQVFSYS